jgi:hypothetical protein
MNLVGLTIEAPRPRGGFSYCHPPTGFKFEIVRDDSDSDDEDGDGCGLVFNPLSFGSAEKVGPPFSLLPILSSSVISQHLCAIQSNLFWRDDS